MKYFLIISILLSIACAKEVTIHPSQIKRVLQCPDTQIVFFRGQSNVAIVAHSLCTGCPSVLVKDTLLNIQRGRCLAYNGLWSSTNKTMVDWNDLPTVDSVDPNHLPCYFLRDEATVASPIIQQLTDSFSNHFWIFGKYAQATTFFGNWKPVYNVTGNHWGDSLSSGQYPVYNTWLITMRKILALVHKDSTQVNFIVVYHGENDGQKIGTDTGKSAKSKSDLISLTERDHFHFPNAKILIIETAYPKQQTNAGFMAVRANEKFLANNYCYVYDIDSTTYLIPNSQSYDGLHLRIEATHSIATETGKNLKQLIH